MAVDQYIELFSDGSFAMNGVAYSPAKVKIAINDLQRKAMRDVVDVDPEERIRHAQELEATARECQQALAGAYNLLWMIVTHRLGGETFINDNEMRAAHISQPERVHPVDTQDSHGQALQSEWDMKHMRMRIVATRV